MVLWFSLKPTAQNGSASPQDIPYGPIAGSLQGTEEGDNMLYMFLLNVLTPAELTVYAPSLHEAKMGVPGIWGNPKMI